MKFAVAQINPKVGDLQANMNKILEAYYEGVANGADVVICPEGALTGYPLEDLVLRRSFMDAVDVCIAHIIEDVNNSKHETVLIFGTPKTFGAHTTNAAIVINPVGQPNIQWVIKRELPNYGVFDEKRHFASIGYPSHTVLIKGLKIGLMICEDCWHPTVSKELWEDGAAMLVSINGSPFETGKNVVRRKVIANRIKETGLPFMYVNMVGGQDELVFDGASFYYDGKTVQEAPAFFEGVTYFEVAVEDHPQGRFIPPATVDNYPIIDPSGVAEIYQATVMGVRDYMAKQGFKSVVLGYSGGVDSGIVAAIASDAIGANNVHLVRLPSKFSSDHSLVDAADGAERLGAPLRTISIEGVVNALRLAYTTTQHHEGGDQQRVLTGTADENIQARARGNILMAISNQEGHLLLTTGNKSEVSVGYSTLYGDMAGGFNPIKDCYKTTVWELCRWRNALTAEEIAVYGFLGKGDIEVVPEAIITKPPSAELRADQKDSDSLPVYEVLDKILQGLIEDEKSNAEIVSDGVADITTVTRIRRLLDSAEYKRRQAAPGVKITSKLFGRDRRYPIVNGWRA